MSSSINVTCSILFVPHCVVRMRLPLLLDDYVVVSKEVNGRSIYLLSCVHLYLFYFPSFFLFSLHSKKSQTSYKYTRFTSCSASNWFSVLLETLVNNQGSDNWRSLTFITVTVKKDNCFEEDKREVLSSPGSGLHHDQILYEFHLNFIFL